MAALWFLLVLAAVGIGLFMLVAVCSRANDLHCIECGAWLESFDGSFVCHECIGNEINRPGGV